MPGQARSAPGGLGYHAINRRNGGRKVFGNRLITPRLEAYWRNWTQAGAAAQSILITVLFTAAKNGRARWSL